MQQKKTFDISSAGLHILAMFFMTLDHLWATVMSDQIWMTCAGRIAFPIFAFLIAEGYKHTGNYRRYMLRLLIAAVISEIPYNLMMEGNPINPFHQNVLWTFLLALLGIRLIDKAKQTGKKWLFVLTASATAFFGYIIGMLTMVDYHGAGILTVLLFYLFGERKWWHMLIQAVVLYWICIELISGIYYPVEIFGMQLDIVKQGFAMLALIPIWLYKGRQGLHTKWFRNFCYAFYPVHMLLLYIIAVLVDRLG